MASEQQREPCHSSTSGTQESCAQHPVAASDPRVPWKRLRIHESSASASADDTSCRASTSCRHGAAFRAGSMVRKGDSCGIGLGREPSGEICGARVPGGYAAHPDQRIYRAGKWVRGGLGAAASEQDAPSASWDQHAFRVHAPRGANVHQGPDDGAHVVRRHGCRGSRALHAGVHATHQDWQPNRGSGWAPHHHATALSAPAAKADRVDDHVHLHPPHRRPALDPATPAPALVHAIPVPPSPPSGHPVLDASDLPSRRFKLE
mmetsp:Transcript_1710/g.5030  ORF Transcript_1710/g.5030 Transcript_1710/m.5030 type:complete len:262 (-) Transcript_1710:249-1034(-)